MAAPTARPLVYQGNATKELPDGMALDGTAYDIPLVAAQTGMALQLVGTDTVIGSSVFLWEKALLPTGRSLYLEATAAGANLGNAVGVVISLYTAAGVLVPNSTITVTSVTEKRVRLSAPLVLADNTEYVVKYRIPGLLGTAYLYFVRLAIR